MAATVFSTSDTDTGEITAYLRLGTYQSKESTLEPSMYDGSFEESDGVFMTTGGVLLVNADQAVQIEFQDDAEILIGDPQDTTDAVLRIDVLEGSSTTETSYTAQGYPVTYEVKDGKSATLKGSGVVINAVTASSAAQSATDKELLVYASDKIKSDSESITEFNSAQNVVVVNTTDTTYSSKVNTFNMGFVNSVTAGFVASIVSSLNTSGIVGSMPGLSIFGVTVKLADFQFAYSSNSIGLAAQKNVGLGAFLIGLTTIYGMAFQENALVEQDQKALGNETKGVGLALKLAGLKSKAVASRTGVQNTM